MDLLGFLPYCFITLALLRCFLPLLRASRRRWRGRPRLPPGPTPLPVIGNLLQLGNMPHRALAQLAQIHGPIMSLKLGRIITVVVSSSALAREVLQKQDLAFSSRFVPNAAHACDHHKYSVVWLPVGSRWRSLRKVLNAHVFSGGMLDAGHHLRRRKVEELVAHAGQCYQEGKAMDVARAAFVTSLNILSNLLFSVDLADLSRNEAQEFKELVWSVMAEAGKPNLVDYFPALAMMDPQGIRRRMSGYLGKVLEMFGRMINNKLEKRKSQKNVPEADLIDILLGISQDNGEEIDRTHIEHLCLVFFVAGTDTISNSFEWAMAELLRNREVMKKAKYELEQVIGKGKQVEESDISHLPYLQAILKETLRLHTPGGFLIPRQVDADVEVCGYTVPKGAQVLVNTWAIGQDPSTWPSPAKFEPERFLGSKIDIHGRDFEMIPFGAGRRICPGISFAVRILPVMLGSMVNLFDWKLEGGIEPQDLDMEEKLGLTLQKCKPLRALPIPV